MCIKNIQECLQDVVKKSQDGVHDGAIEALPGFSLYHTLCDTRKNWWSFYCTVMVSILLFFILLLLTSLNT